jgi:hypothetical protein
MDASDIARVLGRRGGLARSRRLSSGAKARIASQGGHARRESIQAARRIINNLRYAAAVRQLRPGTLDVISRSTASGRLPAVDRHGG